jgi:hypothetical protein
VSLRDLSGITLAEVKATPKGKSVPKITLDGYVLEAEAVQREDGWMPSCTIRDDRSNVDTDDVTDDYRVIAPEDVRHPTQEEATQHAEALGRLWVSQKG